jgi:ADP-ribose pyrophosphatase
MQGHVALCPHCAASEEQPILCDRCGWRWYAKPSPSAGTLVERVGSDGEPSVLLLRRAVDPGSGAWDLPAGYLEPGESPEEGALRETREEAGLLFRSVRLVGVYTSREANAISAIYLARPENASEIALDSESSDHAWVRRREVASWLPRMAFHSMATALADWAAGRRGEPRDW